MIPAVGQHVRLRGTNKVAKVTKIALADGVVVVATGEVWKLRNLSPAPWWLRLLLRLGWPNV